MLETFGAGPSSNAPTQHRCFHRVGRAADHLVGVGVAEWVDVAGVLRPQDDVRLGDTARGHVPGEAEGCLGMVVEHRSTLGVEVEARFGYVALDRGHPHRACRCGSGTGRAAQ